ISNSCLRSASVSRGVRGNCMAPRVCSGAQPVARRPDNESGRPERQTRARVIEPFSAVSTAFCRPRPVSAVRSSGTIRAAQNSVIGAAGVGCSAGAPVRRGEPMDEPQSEPNPVRIPPLGLEGLLGVPHGAVGLVIFAHGSGSDFPRNNEVATGLRERGLATLLLDPLRPGEERRADGFDIEPLASRLAAAADWARGQPELKSLPIGYFGASAGAAAGALVAAARDQNIRAVVSGGGRPDLAKNALAK